ncbi:LPXTG cell wall anchor domain-containing protein [Arcanobacterium hippocoleae]
MGIPTAPISAAEESAAAAGSAANTAVNASDYELMWDAESGGKSAASAASAAQNGRKDPGFKQIDDRNYVYYYDFGGTSSFDFGEMMKHLKAVPKDPARKLPTCYGKNFSINEESSGSNADSHGTSCEIYLDRDGIKNGIMPVVGTASGHYDSIFNDRTKDGSTIKAVNGATYGGKIVLRASAAKHGKKSGGVALSKNAEQSWKFRLQGADVRPPKVDAEKTKQKLQLTDLHIASPESLRAQFAAAKIVASDNVTPADKLKKKIKFTNLRVKRELTLEQIQASAKTGGPKLYSVQLEVKDEAGLTAKEIIKQTLIVAPEIKTPNPVLKEIVQDLQNLTLAEKAKIRTLLQKVNPENTLLGSPGTKVDIDSKSGIITVTYPNGSVAVKLKVADFAGVAKRAKDSADDAADINNIGTETPKRDPLVNNDAADIGNIGDETPGREPLNRNMRGEQDSNKTKADQDSAVSTPQTPRLNSAGAAPAAEAALPQTGADSFAVAAVAVLAILAGLGIVVINQRRKDRTK